MKNPTFFAAFIFFFLILSNNNVFAQWDTTATGIYYNSGNVGINLEEANYLLDVNGTIHTSEVIIDQNFTQPDYVFEEGYLLKSLAEVEEFIKENKHLPGIPSANEVKANGVNLGEIHTKLLLKIEELTLYLIDLKKQNTFLQNRLNKVEGKSKQGEM
ncbi:MAG: hypothetical protein PVH88_26990 [Ignavibacteria bacterium]|jgi:hypothetical protein